MSKPSIDTMYRDSSGRRYADELNIIDVNFQKGMTYTEVYGVHHAAKALREIQKDVKALAKRAGTVEAVVESRQEHDDRIAKQNAERHEAMRKFEERQRVQTADESAPPPAPTEG